MRSGIKIKRPLITTPLLHSVLTLTALLLQPNITGKVQVLTSLLLISLLLLQPGGGGRKRRRAAEFVARVLEAVAR